MLGAVAPEEDARGRRGGIPAMAVVYVAKAEKYSPAEKGKFALPGR